MIELFQAVGDYLSHLWRLIVQAMFLNPATFANVERMPWSGLLTLGVAIIGGISQLLGQSVILFVNRVKPGRFAVSLRLDDLAERPSPVPPRRQLIVLTAVNFTYGFAFWQGAVVVGAGWLLMMVMTNTIGKPVVALRNAMFRRAVGTSLDATTRDILTAFAGETEDERAISEKKA